MKSRFGKVCLDTPMHKANPLFSPALFSPALFSPALLFRYHDRFYMHLAGDIE